MSTAQALWARLRAQYLVEGEAPAADGGHTPWYIRLLLGIAGWLGSFGMLLFELLDAGPAGMVVTGIVLCAVATGLARIRGANDFLTQFAFAISLAGQAAVLLGVGQLSDESISSLAAATVLLGAVLFVAVPQLGHRVWCAALAALALGWIGRSWLLWQLAPLPLTALLAWLWLSEFERARFAAPKRAGGYGILFALLVMFTAAQWLPLSLLLDEPQSTLAVPPLLLPAASAAYGLVLLGSVVLLLRREEVALDSAEGRSAIALTLPLAAACYFAPGLSPFLLSLILGFANGNRVLQGLSVMALLLYLGRYYYLLDLTLLDKSLLLIALGAVLLCARFLLQYLLPRPEAHDHA